MARRKFDSLGNLLFLLTSVFGSASASVNLQPWCYNVSATILKRRILNCEQHLFEPYRDVSYEDRVPVNVWGIAEREVGYEKCANQPSKLPLEKIILYDSSAPLQFTCDIKEELPLQVQCKVVAGNPKAKLFGYCYLSEATRIDFTVEFKISTSTSTERSMIDLKWVAKSSNETTFALERISKPVAYLERMEINSNDTLVVIECEGRGYPFPTSMSLSYRECNFNNTWSSVKKESICMRNDGLEPMHLLNFTTENTGGMFPSMKISSLPVAIESDYGRVECLVSSDQGRGVSSTTWCVYDPETEFRILATTKTTNNTQGWILPGLTLEFTCQISDCLYDAGIRIMFNGKYLELDPQPLEKTLVTLNETYSRIETYSKGRRDFNLTTNIFMSEKWTGQYSCVTMRRKTGEIVAKNKTVEITPRGGHNIGGTHHPKDDGTMGRIFCRHLSSDSILVYFTPDCEYENISETDCPKMDTVNYEIDFKSADYTVVEVIETKNQSGVYTCRSYKWHRRSPSMEHRVYVCGQEQQRLILNAPETVEAYENFNITCEAAKCDYKNVKIKMGHPNEQESQEMYLNLNYAPYVETTEFYMSVTAYFTNTYENLTIHFFCEAERIEEPIADMKETFVVIDPGSLGNSTIGSTSDFGWAALFSSITIIVLASTAVAFAFYQKRQTQKRFQALLEKLKKGNIEKIDPKVPIQEQSQLLPLDPKWDFPRSRLQLKGELGAGCFGTVLMGEATGILPGEEKTKVAVKVAKIESDEDMLMSLVSELKILSHMGQHPHVVRLLGAVLDGITQNQIMIIFELCQHGSLNNYLVENRTRFVTKTTVAQYENVETLRSDEVNAAGVSGEALEANVFNTNVLISWSYQISRGMEWLASKRLLHGDLATRNVLLAKNNIAKISDFGLSKNMYSTQWYKRRPGTKLPYKWLALESMVENVFSTKSDVWAYGVTLWEIFSLGGGPYKGINCPRYLVEWLEKGERMQRPMNAPEWMYQVMMQCWQADPSARLTFSDLSGILYEYLEDADKRFLQDVEGAELRQQESEYEDMFKKCGGDGVMNAEYAEMAEGNIAGNKEKSGLAESGSPHGSINEETGEATDRNVSFEMVIYANSTQEL